MLKLDSKFYGDIADREHIRSLDRMIVRVKAWREANPDKCKVPDAKGEKLLA